MKLHQHIRSSASYRVRIALALKGLPYENGIVDLLKGDQFAPAYAALNPARLVPLLEDEGTCLTQSLAIIEYLEESHPQPPLLPAGAADRAWVRQLALSIACDIHPLNNLRVLRRLKDSAGFSEEDTQAWARHWIGEGFGALEATLASSARRGAFCFGDLPGLADICLVPQMVNARRVGLELSAYPTLLAIERSCMALPAFSATHPSQWQPAA